MKKGATNLFSNTFYDEEGVDEFGKVIPLDCQQTFVSCTI
jgi:hypothetical protein